MKHLRLTLLDGRVFKYRSANMYGMWVTAHGGFENIARIDIRPFLFWHRIWVKGR